MRLHHGNLLMYQSTEKDISVAFQRLSVTPETQKHGNELKEVTTHSHRNLAQRKEETSPYKICI